MKRIACNISPIKDIVPTLEDMVADAQKPIDLDLSLAELAAELTEKKADQ